MRRAGMVMAIIALVARSAFATDEKATPEKLLKLEGVELFAAAKRLNPDEIAKNSPADVIALASRLYLALAQLNDQDAINSFTASRFLEAACRVCNADQLAGLIDAWDHLSPSRSGKAQGFSSLADAWVRCELDALSKEHSAVQISSVNRPIPPELADVPANLVLAWQAFENARASYDEIVKRNQPPSSISFQDNEKSFYALLTRVLRGEENDPLPKILAYVWSGGCGTGSEMFTGPQSRAIFITLLRERRLAEAVGAALILSDEFNLTRPNEFDSVIKFFNAVGFDWETAMIGAQVAADRHVKGHFGARHPLGRLASYGSERAAIALLEMLPFVPVGDRDEYISALVLFLPQSKEGIKDNGWIEANLGGAVRVSPVKISAETATAIKRALIESSAADVPSPLANALLQGFRRLREKDTAGALRKLQQHPAESINREAADLLRELGEDVEEASAPGPVRLRPLVNGRPLPAGTEVQVGLFHHQNGGSNSSSRSVKVDNDGVVRMGREELLDFGNKPTALFVSKQPAGKAGDLWFAVGIPVPPDLDEVTNVPIELATLDLGLQETALRGRSNAGTTAQVDLQRMPQGESDFYTSSSLRFSAEIGQPIRVDLQPGNYNLKVTASGCQHLNQLVTVPSGGTKLNLQLNRGSDVHAEVVKQGSDGNRYALWTLLKDGRRISDNGFDYQTHTFRGLPSGSYVLHIPSRDEARKWTFGHEALGPDEVNYAGRDVAFTVADDSPPTIDLGEIRLEEIPK